MENWDLERKTDKAREAIDDLVAEIESLEKEVERLNGINGELASEIEDLKEENHSLTDKIIELE